MYEEYYYATKNVKNHVIGPMTWMGDMCVFFDFANTLFRLQVGDG